MVIRRSLSLGLLAIAMGVLSACSGRSDDASEVIVIDGPTPKAVCGPGSRPETGLQGRVSQADHDEGRAAQGFTCNTELVGSYDRENVIFTVGGYKVERYIDKAGRECAYYDTTLLFPTNILDANVGVNVLDMSDPSNPVLTARLISLAMLSPHESLVVSQQAGVLSAVMGNPVAYPGIVDVYDLEDDCRHPRLRSSSLTGFLGHESGMAPDGKTFYSSSPASPVLTAVDITSPLFSKVVWTGAYSSHGLTISDDGNRAYLAAGFLSGGNGLLILDVSEVQARKPRPQVREISRLTWKEQTIPQTAIPFTRNGKPYLIEIDEFSTNRPGALIPSANGSRVGAGRIIDISDETKPFVISNLRLEVHEPENREEISTDPGARNLLGGYAGHYCNIPTRVNPDIVACSMILSGLRIFDIRDPQNPREVAYFNAPVNPRLLPLPAKPSNWPMSSPAFAPERKEIWYTDAYSGFYAIRLTNGVW